MSVHCGRQFGGCGEARSDFDESRDVVLSQATQEHTLVKPLAGKVTESHRERMPTVQLHVPVRANEQDARLTDLANHELQERQ